MIGGASNFGDFGVLPLVMDVIEVVLTSPIELAHCAPPLSPNPPKPNMTQNRKILILVLNWFKYKIRGSPPFTTTEYYLKGDCHRIGPLG